MTRHSDQVARRGSRRKDLPHTRPPRSTAEKVFLALTTVALLTLVAITALAWPALPARILVHAGVNGKSNVYVVRNGFLLLPGAALALTIFFVMKLRYPWTFNYSVEITPENAARYYWRARMRLTAAIFFLVVILILFQSQTILLDLGIGVTLFHRIYPTILMIADVAIPFAACELVVRLCERGR